MSDPVLGAERTREKSRHGCLGAYLGVLLIVHISIALYSLSFLVGSPPTHRSSARLWSPALSTAAAIALVVCAIALLRWKRWGFYGYVITAIVFFGLRLGYSSRPSLAPFALLGPVILFYLLHVGGERKAWRQLE